MSDLKILIKMWNYVYKLCENIKYLYRRKIIYNFCYDSKKI